MAARFRRQIPPRFGCPVIFSFRFISRAIWLNYRVRFSAELPPHLPCVLAIGPTIFASKFCPKFCPLKISLLTCWLNYIAVKLDPLLCVQVRVLIGLTTQCPNLHVSVEILPPTLPLSSCLEIGLHDSFRRQVASSHHTWLNQAFSSVVSPLIFPVVVIG